MTKIQPFSRVMRPEILAVVSEMAPNILGFPGASEGLRRASLRVGAKSIGMLDDTDLSLLSEPLEWLMTSCKEIALCATAIVGYITQPLDDYNEYQLFGDICLPRKDGIHVERFGLWTSTISTSIARHFNTVSVLKCKYRSGPRFRKSTSDYCESMLVSLCRIMSRPELRRFARRMEEISGWTSVERSGIPLVVHLEPQNTRTPNARLN